MWTYTTLSNVTYWYSEPSPVKSETTPNENFPSTGTVLNAKTGIGGGPVLLLDGNIKNTYEEEILSDIGATVNRPRSAIGITNDKKMILFVCEGDGMTTGVAGMTTENVANIMKTLGCTDAINLDKPIIDPDIIFFAYFNDEPIGFFITVPDLNRIIGKFNGKFGLIQKLRLMWELKVRKSCDRIFGIIFGIAPEFHGKGVESAIMARYWHFMMETQSRYKTLELAWIGDFNPVMNRMIETYVCATRHKIHTTYRYLFDRTKEFHRCPRLGVKRRE